MLNMFRKYAREIVMVTVALFVVSLFGLGAFSWFGRTQDKSSSKDGTSQSSLATLDGKPVDEPRFYRQFNQSFSAIPEAQRILVDPDMMDYYRYDALEKTISFMLMLREADKQGIKALPQEVHYRVEQIAKMYQLKSVGELKKILKQRKIPWKGFKNEQKEEIMVAKTVNGISGRVTVTPMDKLMAFTEIQARHILIKIQTDNMEEDVKALKKAERIYETVLSNRGAFSQYAKTYSEDKLSAENGGDLGWISRGQMVSEFEKQLYKMKPGDIV
ncbi:MAG: peptidylprolyl isomerase, partial [Candidatus Margulisiibacteriota bacterium]